MSGLVLDHVSKVYHSGGRDVVALQDVCLDVRDGECVAVIGESGSGKSTMTRLVMGLERPTTGSVQVGCLDPMAVARGRAGSGSAIVMQDPTDALDPRLSVESIVGEPLKVLKPRQSRAEIHDRVVDALDRVGLDKSLLHRRPNQLSGGQQQRVGIARALVRDPELLVLDEPTSALDPSVQAQVLRLIADLRERLGIAVLLITHDLAVAAYLADRLLVLRHGRVVEVGTAEQIWNSPRHPYSQALLEASSYASNDALSAALPDDSPARSCIFFDVCGGRGATPCTGTTGGVMVEVEEQHHVAENCHLPAPGRVVV